MAISLNIGHTQNYATVHIGNITLHFSYRTVIAFEGAGYEFTIRENDWGPTTGKHLNMLDGGSAAAKKQRIPGEQFVEMLNDIQRRIAVLPEAVAA